MARAVAVCGIIVLVSLLFLGLGAFGLRLLLNMGANPQPAPDLPPEPSAQVPSEPVKPVATPILSPEHQKLMEIGKSVFVQCAACHGPEGKPVIPGMAPSLAGSPIANGPSERMAAVVLNGIQPEGRFQGVMVPWKAMLTDEQIAGVLTFVRSHFGNQAPAVTQAMIAFARTKYAAQTTPMKRSDVEAIQAELPKG